MSDKYCELMVHQLPDGRLELRDQEVRRVRGIRKLDVHQHMGDALTATITVILFNDNKPVPAK